MGLWGWPMRRKVIQIAESTQLISLPRKWCIEHGIKKGEELEVTEEGTKLIVDTAKEFLMTRSKILIEKPEKLFGQTIRSTYIMGVDELEVEFGQPEVLKLVQNESAKLLGFEIVSHSNKGCVIRSVASALDTEFDSILRRTLLLLTEMAKDSLVALKSGNFSALSEIVERERINNKLTAFCLRVLNKKGYKDRKKMTAMYGLVCELEYLADEYREISNYVQAKKCRLDPKVLSLFQGMVERTQEFYELVYKFTIESLALFIRKLNDESYKKALDLLHNSKRHNTRVLHHLISISEKLYHSTVFLSQ